MPGFNGNIFVINLGNNGGQLEVFNWQKGKSSDQPIVQNAKKSVILLLIPNARKFLKLYKINIAINGNLIGNIFLSFNSFPCWIHVVYSVYHDPERAVCSNLRSSDNLIIATGIDALTRYVTYCKFELFL